MKDNSKNSRRAIGCEQLLRNQRKVNYSKNSETDYLRVQAMKINARPQCTESPICTEREENSSQDKRFFYKDL